MEYSGLYVNHVKPSVNRFHRPVLMVHGLWGGSWQWMKFQRYAETQDWETLAVDLRHHGRSGNGNSTLESTDLMDYVIDVLKILTMVGPCHLIGHSMGGLLVQKVATMAPSMVESLTLLASAGPKGIHNLREQTAERTWKPRHLKAMLEKKPLRLDESDLKRLILNRLAPALANLYAREFSAESGLAVFEIVRNTLDVNEKAIVCPVVVVAGSQDRMTPVAVQRQLAAKYSARYVEYAQGGHLPMLEPHALDVARGVFGWLQWLDFCETQEVR